MALSDEDLIAILRKEENAASNWNDAELQSGRISAQKYYDRELLGDEQEGQSKVVTSEFQNTIESFMPALMRVFASGEEIAEFTPMSPGDEEWAKQATQYVPHVVMRENDGFRILHTLFKDALMGRMGAAAVDLDVVDKAKKDPVEGWTQEQVDLAPQLLKEKVPDAEDIGLEVEADPMSGLFNGSISYKRQKKRVVIDNIAPEDVRITPGSRDIDVASLAGYVKLVTASDLRKLGVKQDDIDELSSDRGSQSPEEYQRQTSDLTYSERKDSEKRFWLVLAYVKADDNGDGISETLRVLYAHAGGKASRIIERTEWTDGEVPIAIATPILMPHTIIGRSLFDQVKDLQDVKTALTRGLLDNTYLSNRPRLGINAQVNINQVLDWTPGMPIQVQGNTNPGAAITEIKVQSIIGQVLPALEHFDGELENRTGMSRHNQGLEADSLNKTASGMSMLMSAAQQRQELIARTIAETCVKPLMRLVYRAIKRSATGPTKYYTGDDWGECDPTKWPDDMHLVVNVALGTGNKQQEMQNLMLIGAAQEKLAIAQGGPTGPLVNMEHYANTARKLVEAAGFKSAGMFVASPKEVKEAPPSQPKPDPEMAKVQAKAQADQAMLQAKMQGDQQSLQANIALKRMEMEADIGLQREKAAAELGMMREKNAMEIQHKREMMMLDAQLKQQELAAETALGKYEIDNAPKPAPGAASLKEQQVSQ